MRKHFLTRFFCGAIGFCLTISFASYSEKPLSVEDVCAHAIEYAANIPPIRFEMAVDLFMDSSDPALQWRRNLPADQPAERNVATICYASRKAAYNETYSISDAKTLVLEEQSKDRNVWDGQRFYHVTQPAARFKSPLRVGFEEASAEKTLAAFDSSPLRGGFLHGRLAHVGMDWARWLTEPGVTVLQQVEEQTSTGVLMRIDAETQRGKMVVWLDQERGYALTRARVDVRAGDLAWGSPLSESGITSMTLEISDVKFQQVGGYFLPIEGKLQEHRTYESGVTDACTITARCSNIEINPDFERTGDFHLDIPDGTRVVNYDFQGIKYEWRNGQLSPVVDTSIIKGIDQTLEKNSLVSDTDREPQAEAAPSGSAKSVKRIGDTARRGSIEYLGAVAVLALLVMAVPVRQRARRKRMRIQAATAESGIDG